MLPIAINLFEGLGEKDEFVKTCTEAFNKDLDARQCFYEQYIMKIFDDNTIAKAFVDHYSILDNTATEILKTAYTSNGF